jgi:DNA-binding transcriptional LysR family regulator
MRRDIDVRLLRAFVAVAETGRMTQAAKVIHLTQSAVSQRILRLERLLDLTLLERRSDAATLTKDGERFMSRARRLIALNDEILSEMDSGDFAGEIRIGVPHDVVGSLLPPVLREFRQTHPNILVTLVSDMSSSLRKLLNDRKLDVALTTDRDRAARKDCLLADTLVWVGAEDGSAARRRPLSVALGRDGCGFRASAVDALEKAGIAWRSICQVGSLEPVFATLEADMAIAPFLSRTVPNRLTILKDADLPALPQFFINLRFASGPVTPASDAFVRHVRHGLAARYI